jgi:hypothetical protein
MEKKRLFSLAIAYLLFAFVFFAANDIILSIPWKNLDGLRKTEIYKFDNLSGEIKFKLESFIKNQDILSTVEFIGWAFIPSQQADENKAIKLVFVSEDNRYEVDTALQERFDILAILQENKVPGYKHGFRAGFSPLEMKNGIYKLYLFCYENEEISGIVDTERMYLKTYRNFSEYQDTPVLETNP